MNIKGALKLEHIYGKIKLVKNKKTLKLSSIKAVRKLMVSDEGINLSLESGRFPIPSGIRDLYCT